MKTHIYTHFIIPARLVIRPPTVDIHSGQLPDFSVCLTIRLASRESILSHFHSRAHSMNTYVSTDYVQSRVKEDTESNKTFSLLAEILIWQKSTLLSTIPL